jgi:4-hydroxybenzoate polyprenyltransferase
MARNAFNETGYSGESRSTEKEVHESKLKGFIDYIKLEHTVFDIPFIVAGSFIAAGKYPGTRIIILVILAGTLARATGMSINRLLGRKYDVINPRKRKWGLVTGSLSMTSAITFTVITAALFELCTFLLNRFVLILSPVVLALFIIDPMLKRVTRWRHFFMGLTIGVGVMAGYLAVIPHFPSSPEIYILVVTTATWIGGFDMVYTIPDVDYDRENNLKTVMTAYGVRKGMIISDITHAFTLLFFTLLIFYISSYLYAAELVLIYFLIIYQHYVLDPDDPSTVRVSFLNSNSFIGISFLIVLILTQYVPLLAL